MNKTVFVNQLDEKVQNEIAKDIKKVLQSEGIEKEDITEIVSNALDSRLSDLTDVIDINKYLKEVK